MKKSSTKICRKAFSLVEAITVLVIAAMIIVAGINLFSRVKASATTINQRLDETIQTTEILQRIAEDIDRLTSPGFDTTLTLKNKFENGYNLTQMILENRFYDKNQKPQIFEKIVWQSDYDYVEDSVILYRSHSGLNLEDKVIDKYLEEQEKGSELFIPFCEGITLFSIQIPKGQEFADSWNSRTLPRAVNIVVSFAEYEEIFPGVFEVPPEKIMSRTVAIDRTRKIKFVFVERDFEKEYLDENDPNNMDFDEEYSEYMDSEDGQLQNESFNP